VRAAIISTSLIGLALRLWILFLPGLSLGTDLALGDGRRPGSGAGQVPAVNQAWRQAFSTAGWVLLTPISSVRIPWNPALLAYFHSHFRMARHVNTYTLYVRDGTRSGGRKVHAAGYGGAVNHPDAAPGRHPFVTVAW
jgi:hypothetical protein